MNYQNDNCADASANGSAQLRFTVPPDCDKMPAKHFLKGRCGLSTRMITQLKREKNGILMNGKILRTVDRVEAGAEVVVSLPREEMRIEPCEGSLDIVYEDSALLVVNKPPFMPVHPVKQYQTDTLANLAAYHSREIGEDYVFRAVNRLDRNTSGLVLIAKERFTVNILKRAVYKEYLALVHGRLDGEGTVALPIGLHPDSKIRRHVVNEGPLCITHYRSLYSSKELSVLSLWLETGKTHQIRCHMAHLGHPLLGDDLYGGSRELINRHALHCKTMRFVHPVTQKKTELFAALPDDMYSIINNY